MSKQYDIFISYRRKGGIKDARLVDEKLINNGYSVSFDIDTLGRGKFTDILNARLKACKDFIVIFEPSYYEKFYDENGNVLPKDILDEDWCYLELKKALEWNKNIIPLIPKDFVFPKNLPAAIRDIVEMNSIQLTEKEFKEIFEYKVKSYLISKPKFTYRYKKSIITALLLAVLAIIISLIFFSLESQRYAAEERARTEAETKRIVDSIKEAGETRAAFVADSIKKISETQAQAIRDSIRAKETGKRTATATTATAAINQNTSQNTSQNASQNAKPKSELYWVANGDETGKVLFEKLSRADLKSGKCVENGIKISVSKPSCKPSSMGMVKCTYIPQLIAVTCEGAQVDKLTFEQTFSGSSKDESAAMQKMLEDLRGANFRAWVNQLQTMRK